MSEISLILVLLFKTNKTLNDMAKIQIKSEKLTPFGGIFSIMEQFLAQTIDSTLGLRCTLFGYQYCEILRSLMCVYLCGGSCSEEIRFLSGVSILQLSFKESIFTGFALQLLYHKNGGGGMSRVTKALRNMPEAMTLIHGYCI